MAEMGHVPNSLERAGPVKQLVVSTLYGWGFNFYDKKNQLRADDLLVRAHLSELLKQAAGKMRMLAADFRREHLGAPTREHPYPDAGAAERSREMERVITRCDKIDTAVRAGESPATDRVMQRHRDEEETLQALLRADLETADLILSFVETLENTAKWDSGLDLVLSSALNDLEAAWRRRNEIMNIVLTW